MRRVSSGCPGRSGRSLGILFLAFCGALVLKSPGIEPLLVRQLNRFLAFSAQNPQALVAFSAVLRNLATSAAFICGGIWTYYVFIGGRTFKPRLSMAIALKDLCGRHRQIAVLHIRIKNEGRTRIRPLSAPSEFYYAIQDDSGQLQFLKFLEMQNILTLSYDRSEVFYLEPQDEFAVDLAILWKPMIVDPDREPLLLVKVLLVDARMNAWREQSIIALQHEKG